MTTETATTTAVLGKDLLDDAEKPANIAPAQPTQPTATSPLDRPDVNLVDHSPFRSMHAFGVAQRMANMLASSSIVPDDYRTWQWKDNQWIENPSAVGNCFIAIELANRLHTSPILIMQQVDMIHGRPSLRGVMLIGLINASGEFTKLRFEQADAPVGSEGYGYRAVAVDRETQEVLYGPWITWAMVNAEGWPNKKGSKWKSMPEQMFQYRAAAFWSRLFAPHITLGLYESEEAHDVAFIEHEERPKAKTSAQLLNDRLEAAESAAGGPAGATTAVSGAVADAGTGDAPEGRSEPPAADSTATVAEPARRVGRRKPLKPAAEVAEEASPGPGEAEPEAESDTPAEVVTADPEPDAAPESTPTKPLFTDLE